MISTTTIISDLNDVPREWVFENYLKLPEKLTGQNLMILSPFNVSDKRPSFGIYVSEKDNRTYRFRDFSTGISGDGTTLIQNIFQLTTRGEAAHKIIEDYNQFILNNKDDYSHREFKVQSKYKVINFEKAEWNNLDAKFWGKFHIGSKLLEKYNVFPLNSYTMQKDTDGYIQELVITGRHNIYGYFRADGTLYKIYQPYLRDTKFIKVRDYIQGTDQLTYKTKYLVICSSLKDMMCLMKLGYKDLEVVAPDSENTLIPAHVMNAYKLKYQGICTLFDVDQPGLLAMENYKNKYGINGVALDLSKDLSDSVRDHGVNKVREVLTPLLKQALQ